ncbi:hypothetical protein NW755_004389 [Fusarium falciforme]|uniref:Uncharacterized protein n=1 Tax=Fusarium falciforme TaxID=195108 RepID=A0A9W8V254_9HYPO|nr:hypothetical protein NW755_004389 [Fusarium falciforme]KAJ4254761.1 hypothetical protein NW757_005088 [Fusarium falciforme]
MDPTLSHISTGSKTEISAASNFDADMDDAQFESKSRMFRLTDSGRLGLTVLGLAAGITILGVSADSIAVYNATHVPGDFLLPLWPANFDLRPTVALVVCSALVMVANAISLVASKVPTMRNKTGVEMTLAFGPPIMALIAAIISMSFFYAVNASTKADTLQSWSCRWENVAMTTQPHFDTLCKQSRAGVALSVLLVPVEVIILGLSAYQFMLRRQLDLTARGPGRKAGSPAMS